MSKGNLAVKEEFDDIIVNEAVINEQSVNNIRIINKEKTNKKYYIEQLKE